MRLLFPIIILYCLAWQFLSSLFIGWDVSWLLHETEKLLKGGHYGTDFFESSPPMILFLYTPVVFFSKFFTIPIFTLTKVYVFFLSSISLVVSYHLIQKIFVKEDLKFANVFLLMMATIFVFLPESLFFGQREHLLLIFIMPYLLLVSCRLQCININKRIVFLIGLMAFLGFAIKPFFVIPFVLIEIYYGINAYFRKLHYFRMENSIIIAGLFFYGLIIVLFYSSYITLVVPLSLRTYYQGLGLSWHTLLKDPVFIYCAIAAWTYICGLRYQSYPQLANILFIAMLGLLTSFFLQHTVWFYHIYPAYSLAILLATLSIITLIKNSKPINYLQILLLSAPWIIFLYFHFKEFNTLFILQPVIFFGYFSCLFVVMLYLLENQLKFVKLVFSIAFIIGLSYFFTFEAKHTDWYRYRLVLTVILLLLSFMIFVRPLQINKGSSTFVVVLAMLMFSFPLSFMDMSYLKALGYKNKMNSVVTFLRQHAKHKPVYFFTTTIIYEYPIVDYSESISVSRYPTLVWLAGYIKQRNQLSDSTMLSQLHKDHNYFLNNVSDEIQKNKPVLILIDDRKIKAYLGESSFEYIREFSLNPQFKAAWGNYRYLTTLEDEPLFKFKVYQRI